ncbi:hypothetical protein FLW53_09370 [Microbispora sp. SCL1-1]|uniref:hypothetical protein n=1 Tax=unclassified Microbispora TaxID=2614687 RepID=UPI001158C984|nr:MULTISPECIES: hypothetical protein [unclassified Microbispora]NJP24409.1 hypothetical protein [Microbispora sp. CL1-1]TQS14562.1 hypothetical protein FLW53_09370 [Microbispora sp. SCL1-1]
MTAPLSDERLAEIRRDFSGGVMGAATVFELLAEVERLRTVVARARDMHWRFDIYDICGCREHEDEAATVTLSDGEVVCRSGYQYSICHECCAPGDSQTEECVDNHDHSECWPCPTRKALDETPSLVGSPS